MPRGRLKKWYPRDSKVTKQLIWSRGCAEAPSSAHLWLSPLPARELTARRWLWPVASPGEGAGGRVPVAVRKRGQPFQLCFRGVGAHSSYSLHFALRSPFGPELGGGGREKWGGLRSQQL